MRDKNNSKEQLIRKLRQRVTELQRTEVEHKKMEAKLRESEERYRSIVELSPDGVITVNLKGIVTSCNKAFSKLTGFPRSEFIGKRFTKIPTMPSGDVPKWLTVFASLIKGRSSRPQEARWLHKDGSTRWAEYHLGLLKKGRRVTGIQAITRDAP